MMKALVGMPSKGHVVLGAALITLRLSQHLPWIEQVAAPGH